MINVKKGLSGIGNIDIKERFSIACDLLSNWVKNSDSVPEIADLDVCSDSIEFLDDFSPIEDAVLDLELQLIETSKVIKYYSGFNELGNYHAEELSKMADTIRNWGIK